MDVKIKNMEIGTNECRQIYSRKFWLLCVNSEKFTSINLESQVTVKPLNCYDFSV